MCLNKKIVVGLVAAAAAIYLIAPGSIGAALPLLIIAACPLSMLFMMRVMSGDRTSPPAKSNPLDSSTTDHEVALLRAEVADLRNGRDRLAPIPTSSRDERTSRDGSPD